MWLFLLFSGFLFLVLQCLVETTPTHLCCLSNSNDDNTTKGKLIYCLEHTTTCSIWSTHTHNFLLLTRLPICLDLGSPYCRQHPYCECCPNDEGLMICFYNIKDVNTQTRGKQIKATTAVIVNDVEDSTEAKAVATVKREPPNTITGVVTQSANQLPSISEVADNATDTADITPSSEGTKNLSSSMTSTVTLGPEQLSSTSKETSDSTNSQDATQEDSNHTIKPSSQDKGNKRINYNYFYILLVIPVAISVGGVYYILKYKKQISEHDFSVVQRQNARRKPEVRPSWVFSEPETSGNEDSEEERNCLQN